MEQRSIDLKSGSTSESQSLIEQVQEHRKAQDATRKIVNLDLPKLRKDIDTVSKWAQSPERARFLELYWTIAKQKLSDKKIPDLATDCPALWNQAKDKFPDLCTRYPRLIKLTITEGHLPAFKTDLNVLLQQLASVQSGVSSVSNCTSAIEHHLSQRYYQANTK